MQRKRIHISTANPAVSVQTNLVGTIEESNGVNVHGLWADMAIEPENADANANGTWVLWCIPDPVSAVPAIGVGTLETEGSNPYIWACGVWAASNQTPFCHSIRPMSSRNCQNGARIVLSVFNQGVSAGNVRHLLMVCYFTKSLQQVNQKPYRGVSPCPFVRKKSNSLGKNNSYQQRQLLELVDFSEHKAQSMKKSVTVLCPSCGARRVRNYELPWAWEQIQTWQQAGFLLLT